MASLKKSGDDIDAGSAQTSGLGIGAGVEAPVYNDGNRRQVRETGANYLRGLTSLSDPDLGSSQSVDTYLENVKKKLDDLDTKGETKFNITFARLNININGVYVFVESTKQAAMVLVFPELSTTLPDQNGLPRPATVNNSQIGQGLHAAYGNDIRILNIIHVDQHSYNLHDNMARRIRTYLSTAVSPQFKSMKFSNMTSGVQYRVSTDINHATDFIRRTWTTSTLPRIDMAVSVTYSDSSRYGNDRNNPNQVINEETLLSVGAFVDISRQEIYDPMTQRSIVKYLPIVRITCIASMLSTANLIPLAAIIATSTMTNNRGWLQPFMNFGAAKGSARTRNIGNLTTDENGKLWTCTSMEQLDQFVAQHFMQPVLAFDIVEGQDRIPALCEYLPGANYSNMYADLCNFFDLSEDQRVFLSQKYPKMMPPTIEATYQYIGEYGADDGVMRDSREIDYLGLASRAGVIKPDMANALLSYPRDPSTRTKVLRESVTSYRPTNECYTMVINPDYLKAISEMIDMNSTLKMMMNMSDQAMADLSDVLSATEGYRTLNGRSVGRGPYQPTTGSGSGMIYGARI